MNQTTNNSRDIKASASKIYQALTDPAALTKWQVPGDMTAKIHYFDLRIGGGYQMSLFYPEREMNSKGKTTSKEDKFSARFIELVPNRKIIEAINFESSDPTFAGEMIVEITLQPLDVGTRVNFLFKNIPVGIKPEDNEVGTMSSLQKLAQLVEH